MIQMKFQKKSELRCSLKYQRKAGSGLDGPKAEGGNSREAVILQAGAHWGRQGSREMGAMARPGGKEEGLRAVAF